MPPSTDAHILLVRHGQSVWNADGRWQGQADPPLSPLGEAQAVTAAAAVPPVERIYSSTLQRAVHTAEIISSFIDVGPVIPCPDLIERGAGEWSGLTRSEIEAQWPGYLASGDRPPGYEPDHTLLERVVRAVRGVAAASEADESSLAVCHGGVIYVLEQLLGSTFDRIANLEGRWVHVSGSELRLGERVTLADPAAVATPIPDLL